MRRLRAFAGVVGASGSVIAAGGLLLAILSAGVAFHGWPNMRDPGDRTGDGATALAAAPNGGAALRAGDDTAVSALPTVPVRRAAVAAVVRRVDERRVERRRASVDDVRERGADRTPATSSPGVSGAPRGTSPSQATAPSHEPSGVSGAGAGASSTATTTPTTTSSSGTAPTPPATPTPTPPVPVAPSSVTDAAAQAVQTTTAAAGGIVSSTTTGAAQTLAPAAPNVASTVSGVGQAVGTTVTQAGQAVGGILTGLGSGAGQ
ncbi:MAG TPA: hypothetical protein VFG42_23755 [Baekduia sp.]|uniref:hypothetical protein n=1 Tax=Baekduia sp. TaxID=2600305 RepID=UPI002D78EB46|nr:hypothetical protein [Baekduia sp.]HET6509830.1 hypothetical protein [Baekduia sp.]